MTPGLLRLTFPWGKGSHLALFPEMKLTHIASAGVLALAAVASTAHEGPSHDSKPVAVKKEQKPWGIAGEAKAAKRTVEIDMSDNMRFAPDRIEAKRGETIQFIVRNNGRLFHEFVIGTKTELDQHAALMMKFPGMEHDEPYMAHVQPGKARALVWKFNRSGEFDFACLVAGHYQAGMTGKIIVKP
jgi:uncharacterized cupredoxin-like copper-binding protein